MKTFIAFVLGLLPLLAQAHPGEHHMSVSAMLNHLFTHPDHLALVLLVVAIGAVMAVRQSRKH